MCRRMERSACFGTRPRQPACTNLNWMAANGVREGRKSGSGVGTGGQKSARSLPASDVEKQIHKAVMAD